MAILEVETIDEAGAVLTLASSASDPGDKWENNGNQQILIENGSESSVTLTVATEVTSFDSPQYGDSTKSNMTLAIAASSIALAGPFPAQAYNDADGYCVITYSATTDIKVAIFEIQK